jgi:fatty-acid desaturase
MFELLFCPVHGIPAFIALVLGGSSQILVLAFQMLVLTFQMYYGRVISLLKGIL